MMLRQLTACSVLGLAAAAGAGAYAQDRYGDDGPGAPGLYFSGGYSYFNFEGDNGLDADVNALTGRAGFQFSQF